MTIRTTQKASDEDARVANQAVRAAVQTISAQVEALHGDGADPGLIYCQTISMMTQILVGSAPDDVPLPMVLRSIALGMGVYLGSHGLGHPGVTAAAAAATADALVDGVKDGAATWRPTAH